MSQSDPQLIGCRDGCGLKCIDPGAIGWTYLEITKLWRCLICTVALASLNQHNEGDNHGTQGEDQAVADQQGVGSV